MGKARLSRVNSRHYDIDVKAVASGNVVDLVCPKYENWGLNCEMDNVPNDCPFDFILGVNDFFDCDLDSVICSACRSGFSSENYEELECPIFQRLCYYVGFCHFLIGFSKFID